jgi:hypothetical protein
VHESQMNHWISVLADTMVPKSPTKLDFKK